MFYSKISVKYIKKTNRTIKKYTIEGLDGYVFDISPRYFQEFTPAGFDGLNDSGKAGFLLKSLNYAAAFISYGRRSEKKPSSLFVSRNALSRNTSILEVVQDMLNKMFTNEGFDRPDFIYNIFIFVPDISSTDFVHHAWLDYLFLRQAKENIVDETLMTYISSDQEKRGFYPTGYLVPVEDKTVQKEAEKKFSDGIKLLQVTDWLPVIETLVDQDVDEIFDNHFPFSIKGEVDRLFPAETVLKNVREETDNGKLSGDVFGNMQAKMELEQAKKMFSTEDFSSLGDGMSFDFKELYEEKEDDDEDDDEDDVGKLSDDLFS